MILSWNGTSDETNPVFTSLTSKDVQENGQLDFTVVATDDSTPITYIVQLEPDV